MSASEAPYKSFAIAGAGPHIGLPIVQAFLALNVPILVLVRPTSTSTSTLPLADPNLKLAHVDYADTPAVSALLRAHSVDVLISAVSLVTGGVGAQTVLADAARDAGVRLFVPSEYGTPTRGDKSGAGLPKDQFAEYLTSIGIPWLRLYCGLFHEFVPWLAAVEETGKFLIVGKGETPNSFTSIPEVAQYLAHVLTTAPPSRLANTELRIEGQRATLAQFGALFAPSRTVAHVDALPLPAGDFRGFVQAKFEIGAGSSGWDCVTETDDAELARSGNALWEGHRWAGVGEVLGLQ
ncbi:NAD(P)-binding protein [Leucogyrophana mollusca]|uniref:NAD(P)-binding protein n=1 Tax=Leucogyrophana mollusca TaxID=85980 RepID=A0ACB8B911_9AGAM|nr:NAD(P)-binding protein [Leucogyrophana mollusca]